LIEERSGRGIEIVVVVVGFAWTTCWWFGFVVFGLFCGPSALLCVAFSSSSFNALLSSSQECLSTP